MILLAFIFPLAVYLLVLGSINRRRHALMVYGPWDFAGVIFAASGFLLLVGPWVLSVFNDPTRDSLLFGTSSSYSSANERHWQWWLFFMWTYFAVVVVGSGLFLWLARKKTAIYNTDQATVETALGQIFDRLGVRPSRSGNTYYFDRPNFGRNDEQLTRSAAAQGIQRAPDGAIDARVPAQPLAIRENVVLELEAFRLMWHVTLRWEPGRSGLRQEIERELERELAETTTPSHELGGWLTILACALFLVTFVLGISILVYGLFHHIL